MMHSSGRLVAVAACFCAIIPAGFSRQAADPRGMDRSYLWKRSGRDLLSGFGNMYNLHVLDTPERPYRYRAWFFGWAVQDCNRHIPGYSACDALFAARSRTLDGPWEVSCGQGRWDAEMKPALWRPIFEPLPSAFDGWHNGDPSVVRIGKRYYMAYSSVGHNVDGIPFGGAGDRDGSLLCIMGAVSDDGVNWRRSIKPILAHHEDFGAPNVAGGEAHMHGSYHRPSLLHEGGRFRLWFDYWAGDRDGCSMGYAECRGDFLDAAQWKVIRAGSKPALRQFPNPDVARVGDRLYAYGDPPEGSTHPWTARKITEAVSKDGLSWTILGHIRPEPDAAALHVPEALAERSGRGWKVHLFYACQIGGEPYDYRYDRIRRMERIVADPRAPATGGLLGAPFVP